MNQVDPAAQIQAAQLRMQEVALRMRSAMNDVGAAAFVGDGIAEANARAMCHVLTDQILDEICNLQRLSRTIINGG